MERPDEKKGSPSAIEGEPYSSRLITQNLFSDQREQPRWLLLFRSLHPGAWNLGLDLSDRLEIEPTRAVELDHHRRLGLVVRLDDEHFRDSEIRHSCSPPFSPKGVYP